MANINNDGDNNISMDSKSTIVEKVRNVVDKIIPPETPTVKQIEEEIWDELSKLYYKYEDEIQKEAFRNVMKEIGRKIENRNWKSIYQKLYRKEQENKTF